MQFRFFLVPAHATGDSAVELNRFLVAHRILAIERQFVADGQNSAWALCVSFDDGGGGIGPGVGVSRSVAGRRGKVDYKDVLSPPEFAVFARLTLHANASVWRREQLRRRPLEPALEAL